MAAISFALTWLIGKCPLSCLVLLPCDCFDDCMMHVVCTMKYCLVLVKFLIPLTHVLYLYLSLGLYVATAGTVYVGAKFIASNMRLEGGPNGERRRVQ